MKGLSQFRTFFRRGVLILVIVWVAFLFYQWLSLVRH